MVLSTEVKSYTSAIHPGSAGWLLFLLDFVSLLLPVTNEQDRRLASREWQALSSVWQQDSHSPISVSRLTHKVSVEFQENNTSACCPLVPNIHTAQYYCCCSGLLTQVHPKPGQIEKVGKPTLFDGEAHYITCVL